MQPQQAIQRFGRRDHSSSWDGRKRMPCDPRVRRIIRDQVALEVATLIDGRPPTRKHLAAVARTVLSKLELDAGYLGFVMVLAANAYWADRLAAVPYRRRLLLLPRCLGGPAPAGPDIEAIRRRAEQLGYRTLIADGTPIVVKTLATDSIEAVVGVACLDSLEAVFEKIWQLEAPAVAVPLLTDNCKDTAADLAWLAEYIESRADRSDRIPGRYLPMLHASASIFAEGPLETLLAEVEPDRRGGGMDATGEIARKWLARGGKRLRPFITLAATAALTGDETDLDGPTEATVKAAVAIEAFHKASLAHDDIEDDDDQRYGRPTLHRTYGAAMAINVGDYLLGLGYRLIAAAGQSLTPAAGMALLNQLSRAHMRLAQGQGAELIWRRNGVSAPPSDEVLRVYALKTAPAFAAALTSGVILGDGNDALSPRLQTIARHVGVGFQLLNDLTDWSEDIHAGRPTYLTATGAEAVGEPGRDDLLRQLAEARCQPEAAEEVAQRLDALGVFRQTNDLLDRLRRRAADLSGRLDPPEMARLCKVLVDLILT